MKRVTGALLVLAFGTVCMAQDPQTDRVIQGDRMIVRQQVIQGPEGAPPPPGNLLFVSSEMSFGGKVVKGAPYSAQAVTESIQTLGDGNRIVNRNSSAVYRDSEGRTRREITLKGLGVLGTGGEPWESVFIHDPVAGVTYALDSKNRTAIKSAPFKVEWDAKGPAGEGMVTGQRFEVRVRQGSGPEAGVVAGAPIGGVTMAAPAVVHDGGQVTFKTEGVAGTGGTSYVFKRSGPNPNEVKQDLGKQLIEGVEAEGSRTTVTIPAGEVGNERPIEIVSERWYSPELQLVVMTRNSDPRSGETIYKLTNISKSEPSKSLFEVPAGYTVKENHPTPVRLKKTPE